MKHAQKSKVSGKKTAVLIVLAVAAFAAAILLAVKLVTGQKKDDGLEYETNVVVGAVDNGLERKAAMQEMVDRGMITMSINASPAWYLSRKEEGVNWEIENPEGQATKLIRVEVYRNDTGKKIYETGALRPGTYVTGTEPDVELEEGVYECTAYFYSYDIETEEFLGKAGSEITLYVQP